MSIQDVLCVRATGELNDTEHALANVGGTTTVSCVEFILDVSIMFSTFNFSKS